MESAADTGRRCTGARIAIVACLLWLGLSGCRERHDAAANATAAARAGEDNQALCNDCDGFEDAAFKAQINAMGAARERCGGRPIEEIDRNRSGMQASDYRCR